MSIPFKIVKGAAGIAGVVAAASEAKQEIEDAINLLGDVFASPAVQRRNTRAAIRARRLTQFRGRNIAATKIQALFRGHKVRQSGRQRMQVDEIQVVNGQIMPRRRAPRRRAAKRKRGRRLSRSRRSKRKRRRAVRTHHLRLLPGGFPLTKKVKLRVYKQCAIHTPDSGVAWGFILFRPADPFDPFNSFRAAMQVSGTHRALGFTLKDGVAVTPRPQPYGWDEWSAIYPNYVVLGSKITITFVQGSNSPASTTQFVAGFSKLVGTGDIDGLQSFTQNYVSVDNTELSDMINVKIIRKPGIIEQIGVGTALLGGAKSFSFNYSLKKTTRMMRKMKLPEMAQDGIIGATASGSPGFNPQTFFIVGDLAGDSATLTMNCFVQIDYTIQYSKHAIDEESIAA